MRQTGTGIGHSSRLIQHSQQSSNSQAKVGLRCAVDLCMAAVDSILRVISARNAEALTIVADGVPELRRGGDEVALSMPPLSAAIVKGFMDEVGGSSSTHYIAEDGRSYSLRVEGGEGNPLRMIFTLLGMHSKAGSPSASNEEVAVPSEKGSSAQQYGDFVQILANAAERGASDILVSADQNSWIRVNGVMQSLPQTTLTSAEILSALRKTDAEIGEKGSLDFSFDCGQRYRVNLFRQDRGIAAALRPIRRIVPTMQALHLPHALLEMVQFQSGLVLVAGTAGSGKSTTVNALIEHVNSGSARHIITLEDPIEYRYASRNSLIHQREIGSQLPSFASGLRAALRESPDIIVVGELRDYETISAAITAAETGHLIFGTIHASDAVVAIDRMIDVFPAAQQQQIRYQLSIVLRATITQRLLPTSDGNSRVPAVELMRNSDAVAASIRSGKTHSILSSIQSGRDAGMLSLERSLATLVRDGSIERSLALATARSPEAIRSLLGVTADS